VLKEIPVGSNHIALVDDEDYPKLRSFRWQAGKHKGRSATYAVARSTTGGYVGLMHRMILNPPAGLLVDHINHDGLDNRRCNLRTATLSQNCANQQKQTNRSSTYKGVTLHLQGGKNPHPWYSQLCKRTDGKLKHRFLGSYTTEAEAAIAYNVAAIAEHGEYACVNNIMSAEHQHDWTDGVVLNQMEVAVDN
jgi:hypothetical protein